MLWPLGLTIAVWFLASLVIGRLYPEAIQRFTVVPNQPAQEERYIANNIAMTRLAFDLDGLGRSAPFRGEAPLTQDVDRRRGGHVPKRAAVGLPAAAATRSTSSRRSASYYDFTDVDTDRYHDRRRSSARSCCRPASSPSSRTRGATGWVNQRIIFTHGIGVAMVPVNEVASEGQPRLFIGNLPPGLARRRARRSPSRGSTSASARARTSSSAPGRPSSTTRPARATSAARSGRPPAGRARPASRSTRRSCGCCSPLRFRDLDLLISDQVTADSQLLFHRSLGDRLGADRPVPALRQGPVRRHRRRRPARLRPGRLHGVATASRTRRRFDPQEQLDGDRPRRRPFNYIRNSVKITMDAYDGTMHFYISDPADPIIRAYAGVFPDLFEPIDAMPERPARPPARARGAVQRPDPPCTAATT